MLKIVDAFQFDESTVVHEDGFQIYTAKHLHQKELYTLKKLNTRTNPDRAKYQSLLNQVSLLKELEHQNIIKCHRMLKTSNSIYLVYDYVPPNTLETVIKTQLKKLSEVDKQAYLRQICKAMVQMKKRGVVHLNLHPKNIYITDEGIVKVGGFVYGQIISGEKEVQLANIPPESDFVAPQVLTKKVGTHSSDIYSLARIFYAMQVCKDEGNLLKVIPSLSNETELASLVKKMGSKNPLLRAPLQEIEAYLFKRVNRVKRSNSKSSKNVQSTQPSRGSKINIANDRSDKSDKGSSKNQSRSRSKSRGSFRRSNSYKDQDIEADTPQRKPGSKPQQQKKEAIAFKKYIQQILKLRNFSIFLLRLASVTAQVPINSEISTILSFMLLKKSTIAIINLAEFMSTGDTDLEINASQIQRIKFSSKADFFKISSFINKQMTLQRKMLERTRQHIQEDLPQLTTMDKFAQQFTKDILQQKYLKQCVIDYIVLVANNEQLLKSIQKKDLEGIFMLGQLLSFETYEKMFESLIKEEDIDLDSQPLILHVKAMDSNTLISSFQKKVKKYS